MLVMACLQLLVESLNFNTFMSVIISFFMSSVTVLIMSAWNSIFVDFIIGQVLILCVCAKLLFFILS